MRTRSLLWACGVALAALVFTASPDARSARSACLERQLAGAMAQGWHSRGVDTESLLPGDTTRYEMSFYKGSRYLFLACTEDDNAGITLVVQDGDGAVLGKPSDKGTSAMLEVKAAKAGAHVMLLTLESATEGRPTYYSLAMLYR